jgi:mannitol-1-/sugar-/sorbitol-6-/2-deoxyglucose-6-phosphatase
MPSSQVSFQAAIFDLDGILIDSEPLWRRAMISVFGVHGLHLTPEECALTMGLRIDEVIRYWNRKLPGIALDVDATSGAIVEEVALLIRTEGVEMPGARAAVERCRALGMKVGVASSSALRLIEEAVSKLGLESSMSTLKSAQFESRGKPDPAVYLSAARELGVVPSRSLAIEDSVNGMKAAKAAEMCCLCVPERGVNWDLFREADYVIASLSDITDELLIELAVTRSS